MLIIFQIDVEQFIILKHGGTLQYIDDLLHLQLNPVEINGISRFRHRRMTLFIGTLRRNCLIDQIVKFSVLVLDIRILSKFHIIVEIRLSEKDRTLTLSDSEVTVLIVCDIMAVIAQVFLNICHRKLINIRRNFIGIHNTGDRHRNIKSGILGCHGHSDDVIIVVNITKRRIFDHKLRNLLSNDDLSVTDVCSSLQHLRAGDQPVRKKAHRQTDRDAVINSLIVVSAGHISRQLEIDNRVGCFSVEHSPDPPVIDLCSRIVCQGFQERSHIVGHGGNIQNVAVVLLLCLNDLSESLAEHRGDKDKSGTEEHQAHGKTLLAFLLHHVLEVFPVTATYRGTEMK